MQPSNKPGDENIGALLEQTARIAHEVNRAYCRAMGDLSHLPWQAAPEWQRESAVAGVQHILNNPTTTPEQSHASWMRHKALEGWVWGPKKDPEARTHPCMVPYSELPQEQRTKDALFIAVVLSNLIEE